MIRRTTIQTQHLSQFPRHAVDQERLSVRRPARTKRYPPRSLLAAREQILDSVQDTDNHHLIDLAPNPLQSFPFIDSILLAERPE